MVEAPKGAAIICEDCTLRALNVMLERARAHVRRLETGNRPAVMVAADLYGEDA